MGSKWGQPMNFRKRVFRLVQILPQEITRKTKPGTGLLLSDRITGSTNVLFPGQMQSALKNSLRHAKTIGF
jgi:hypothetical protein